MVLKKGISPGEIRHHRRGRDSDKDKWNKILPLRRGGCGNEHDSLYVYPTRNILTTVDFFKKISRRIRIDGVMVDRGPWYGIELSRAYVDTHDPWAGESHRISIQFVQGRGYSTAT